VSSAEAGGGPRDAGDPGDATVAVGAPDAHPPVEATVQGETGPGVSPPCVADDAGEGSDADASCPALVPDPVPDGGACPGGLVTFHLDVPGWFAGGSYDTPAPGANWLTVFCPAGTQLPFGMGAVNETNRGFECSTCQQMYGFALGGSLSQLDDAGTTQTWDGVYFQDGQCYSDAGPLQVVPPRMPGWCVTRGCAPPGRYAAVFCAYPSLATPQANVDASCTTVPFDYPSATAVRATLPVEGGCP
jgi:hypothetical protein